MTYEERDHTADRCLRVRAETLEALFAEAARGMNALAGIRLESGGRRARQLDLAAPDREGLLVAFLSELLFAAEQERLAFDRFELELGPGRLAARVEGAAIQRQERLLKAVTYHNLAIRRSGRGFQVEIVFDV